MRKSPQQTIALLMEDGVETVIMDTEEGDAASTQVKTCSAAKCRHNVDGARCGLDVVTISDTGGCAEYEACADDYDRDEATIIGISSMIPEIPDHHSTAGNMIGKFLPDMMK